jgi:cytochrome c553
MRSRFVRGAIIVALVSGASCSKTALRPIATVEQIMETTVEPVSNKVFDAAVWENGVQIGGPQTDDDWKLIEANALMLAETGNLLLMGSRMKDQTGWVTRTQAMMDAAKEAAKAAAAKNTGAVFDAGAKIYEACTGCHQQYINPLTVQPRAGAN